MKKVKKYHIVNFTLDEFINKFLLEKDYVIKNIDFETYKEKYFGTKLYTYQQISKLELKLNLVHNNYGKTKEHYSIEKVKEYRSLLNSIFPQRLVDFAKILKIELKREDYLRSISCDKSIENSFPLIRIIYKKLKEGEKNIISDNDLKYYVNKYYDSHDEFFIGILSRELSFLNDYQIFGKAFDLIADILGYKLSKEMSETLNAINRNRFYYEAKIDINKLSKKQQELVIEKIIDNTIWLDSSYHKTILNIADSFKKISYESIKRLIFDKANRCSSVISGNVTRGSYSLPFDYILTNDDYDFMIKNIIFVGNNAIKINIK